MKNSGIYKIQSISKPERAYIGSAIDINGRWLDHLSLLKLNKHHSIKLQSHYNKYGKEDFVFIIIEPCLPTFLIEREQFYINTLDPWFNICKIAGSQLGIKRSEEFKQEIKERMKGNKIWLGRHHKEESKKEIGKSKEGNHYNLGRHFKDSKETKKRKSIARIGEKNPNYGKHPSEKTLIKLRKPKSKETREKISKNKKEFYANGGKNPMYGVHRFGKDAPNYKKIEVAVL